MQTSDSRLPLLDYCRFVAALSVLSFHYFWNGIANGKITSLDHVEALTTWAKYGYLGVELFFMISGYVIFMSARRRSTSQFIVGRAVRLYPAYLVAMLVTTCFAIWLGSGETSVNIKQVIGNIAFYQPLHHQRFVDGVYWTLMIEVKFYFAVAVLIAVGGQKYFNALFKAWPVCMLIAFAVGGGAWNDPERGAWTLLGGYYAFFASGALFAIIRERASAWAYAALAISTALGMRYVLAMASVHGTQTEIVVTAVILCFFTLMFFLINWSADGRVTSLPAANLLGALTYPLYLVHAHIGYMLLSRFGSTEYRVFSYTLTIGFVFLLAWLIHEIVEVRWSAFWRSCFERVVGIAERPLKYLVRIPVQWRDRRVETSPNLRERGTPVQGSDAASFEDGMPRAPALSADAPFNVDN
jgi:peptidoglycan/LPS O-acetylase OafA/YrhL